MHHTALWHKTLMPLKHWIRFYPNSQNIIFQISYDDQLVSHSVGSIKQNMPMPENLTSLHVRMLLEIFGVREEKRRPPVVSCMGRGYDIIHDEVKSHLIDEHCFLILLHFSSADQGSQHLRLQAGRLLRGRVRNPSA